MVEFQTETNASLVGPKGEFSAGWFVFWWIIPGPGFVIYAIYHHFIKSKKQAIELYVKGGKVKVAARRGLRLAQVKRAPRLMSCSACSLMPPSPPSPHRFASQGLEPRPAIHSSRRLLKGHSSHRTIRALR